MSGPKYTGADYEKVMALDAQSLTSREIVGGDRRVQPTVERMRNGQWEPPSAASMPLLGRSPLTGVIEEHMDSGWTLDELTVLARDNDPFRQDRSEGHKLGQWLRGTLEAMGFQVGEGGRTIHNRGLHYLLIGQRKPDGSVYATPRRVEVADRPGEQGGPVARLYPVRPGHRPAQRRAGHPHPPGCCRGADPRRVRLR